jgi:hypothetical protein
VNYTANGYEDSGKFKADSTFEVIVGGASNWLNLHTSCSQPLNVGDQFGAIRIVSLVSTQGGQIVYEEPPVVEEIVEQLGLSGLEHHKAREQYGLASGLVERGKAMVTVLNLIRFGEDLCVRLMAAGTLGGCWGRVVLWDPKFSRRLSPLSRVGRASRSPPFV